MQYQKILMVIVCLIVMFSALGCSVKNSNEKNMSEEFSEIPHNYKEKNKFLEFDTEIVHKNQGENLYKSKAVKTKFEADVVVPLMFGDRIDSTEIKGDGNNFIYSNGNSFYVQEDYLAFNSNSILQTCIMKSFSLFDEQYTAEKFELIEEPYVSSADLKIKQKIIDTCNSMGVDNFNLHKMYKLDYQKLRENEQHKDKMGNDVESAYKEEWLETDNSTYWLGNQIWQELPVFSSTFSSDVTDTWVPIQILYTKSGIEKIQVLYAFKFEKTTEKVKICNFDEVAKALTKEYSLLLTDNKYIATKAELYYWVDVNQTDIKYEMIPVWVFTIREYNSDTEEDYVEYQKLVNAETAEVLEVGE